MVIDVIGSVGFMAVALVCLPHVRASLLQRCDLWRSRRRLKRALKGCANAAVCR